MIKTLAVSFFILVTSFFNPVQEDTTIKATYEKIVDGEYYFMNEDSKSIVFQGMSKEASEEYDLMDVNYLGKTFWITYKTNTIEKEGGAPDYYLNIITDISME